MALDKATGQPQPMQDGEFHSQSQPSVVTWDLKKLAPPSPLYITRDDQMLVQFLGGSTSVIVQVMARVLTVDSSVQTIQQQFAVAVADTQRNVSVQLCEGFLLSATCVVVAGGGTGPIFARMALCRTAVGTGAITTVLTAGDPFASGGLCWPSQTPVAAQEAATTIRVFQTGAFSTGQDINQAVSSNHRWRVVSILATFTASAAVANRRPTFIFRTGGAVEFFRSSANINVTAGQTVKFSMFNGVASGALDTTGLLYGVPLPPRVLLASGFVLASSTTAIDVGDQWSSVNLLLEDTYENV